MSTGYRRPSLTAVLHDLPARLPASCNSIRLDVVAPGRAHLSAQRVPVDPCAAADIGESFVDAGLHALQATEIDMRPVAFQESDHLVRRRPHAILHIGFRLARYARIGEVFA